MTFVVVSLYQTQIYEAGSDDGDEETRRTDFERPTERCERQDASFGGYRTGGAKGDHR